MFVLIASPPNAPGAAAVYGPYPTAEDAVYAGRDPDGPIRPADLAWQVMPVTKEIAKRREHDANDAHRWRECGNAKDVGCD